MELMILFIVIFLALMLNLMIVLTRIRKVYILHKYAHTTKYINDGKFNEAYNISTVPADNKKEWLDPVVNIDNKKLKTIIFINNVNLVMLGDEDDLIVELNLAIDDRLYYFIVNNYKLRSGQRLATNMIYNNFPKLYKNDMDFNHYINLEELGYDGFTKIKADDITAIHFDGKNKEMLILLNDIFGTVFYIDYRSKEKMVEKIKKSSLYNHIMQWGVAGYDKSSLTSSKMDYEKEDYNENI